MKKRSKILLGVCAVAVLALLLGLYTQLQSARQQNQALGDQLQHMQSSIQALQLQVDRAPVAQVAVQPTPRATPSPSSSVSLDAQSPQSVTVAPSQQTVSRTVYITKTGKKYHRLGCQYLRQSSIPIELDKAIAAGYGPCSRCNP